MGAAAANGDEEFNRRNRDYGKEEDYMSDEFSDGSDFRDEEDEEFSYSDENNEEYLGPYSSGMEEEEYFRGIKYPQKKNSGHVLYENRTNGSPQTAAVKANQMRMAQTHA